MSPSLIVLSMLLCCMLLSGHEDIFFLVDHQLYVHSYFSHRPLSLEL